MTRNTAPQALKQKPSDASRQYQRIVVKAGTGVLTGGTDTLHAPTMESLVSQISRLYGQGKEILLVTSGAIAAGMKSLGVKEQARQVSFRQVLAAVGQNHLMHAYSSLFEPLEIPVAQVLLTRRDLDDRQGYLNVRNTILSLLQQRVVPIINENDVVAVDEIGPVFGDNDTLSALVANLVDADLLLVLTDMDGLFTADPRKNPNATLIPRVERIDSYVESLAGKHVSSWSRGGMSSKLQACKVATRSGVPAVICNGREPDVVSRVVGGEDVGTYFATSVSKIESRKRWMLSGLSLHGDIIVDEGAEASLRRRHGSLLPVGIREVSGPFQRGDIVYISNQQRERFACGLVNYSSDQVEAIKGKRSDGIPDLIGCSYGQEVIHRNNLALI
jgi:glutamate 5-kinase